MTQLKNLPHVFSVDVPAGTRVYRCRYRADSPAEVERLGLPDEHRFRDVRCAFTVPEASLKPAHPEWVFWRAWGYAMAARRAEVVIKP